MINTRGNFRSRGFASGNLIEECLELLLKLKLASDLQLQKTSTEEQRVQIITETKKHAASIVAGPSCIGSKEFIAIFNITCLVPFIRPSLQLLPQKDIEERRALESRKMRETGTRESNRKSAQQTLLRLNEVVKAKEYLAFQVQQSLACLGRIVPEPSMLLKLTEKETQRALQHKHAFTSSISPLRKADPQQTV